jgi:hypothetical protein
LVLRDRLVDDAVDALDPDSAERSVLHVEAGASIGEPPPSSITRSSRIVSVPRGHRHQGSADLLSRLNDSGKSLSDDMTGAG